MKSNQEIDTGKPETVIPGIGRLAFLGWFVVWAVVATVAKDIGGNGTGDVLWLFANLIILVPASASRLENIGSRAAWCWLCMVSLVGLLVALHCLIAPAGYTQSKKLDMPAKAVDNNIYPEKLVFCPGRFQIVSE